MLGIAAATAVVAVVCLAITGGGARSASSPVEASIPRLGESHLDSRLVAAVDASSSHGVAASAAIARNSGLDVLGARVQVVVEPMQGQGREAR